MYQSTISPYDKSHCYALHLSTQASSKLFTPLHVTSLLICPGTTHLTLDLYHTPLINWVSSSYVKGSK